MSRKPLLFLTILFYECITPVFAGDIVPVLLRVPKADQHDTLGCNFVEEVTRLVYQEIIAGNVKLWDAPGKEIQITGPTLVQLEKSSDTKFTEQEIFFIYEKWQKTKTGINTNTIGFTFLNKNVRAEDVSYGFVDFSDLKELFAKNKINTNANGIYTINYATYLYKKLFSFNIVQFEGKTITSGGESQNIKADFIGNLEFNPAVNIPAVPDKNIIYLIENNKNTEDSKALNSRELIKQVENYLAVNEEIFYNLGGDKFADYIGQNKIRVTKIEVNEIWKKSTDGIYYLPKTVKIFVNDSSLNTISFNEFGDFHLDINSKSTLQLFSEKDYSFVITQINSQKISRKESYLYFKALMTYDWGKLTEFVKYY
ncbi:MAG TPA: hypothetical protein VJY62_14995 [Bacteroidia bacterium]|nr:hypothetical protein [Bacteroidia bacterium]